MTVRMTITDLMSAAGLVAAVVVTSRAMRLRMEAKVVVAALRASGPIHVNDCDHVATSFPGFAALARGVGLNIKEVN